MLFFYFLLKLNKVYISLSPKWTEVHTGRERTFCLVLYPYHSQQNKSKVSCHLTLNQNKFQNQRWILLQSPTSVIFVFRQQLFTCALFERESCNMDLSIHISPIISYCEIYSSVPVRNSPLNLMGK